LPMGSWKSLNNKLYFAGKQDAKESKSKEQEVKSYGLTPLMV